MDRKAGNAIQRARIGSGLTQEALAERTGYSPDSVRAWESGARTCPLDALDMLSTALSAPWLTGVYLREHSSALDELIPDIRIGRPLSEAAAEYISRVLDLVDGRFDRKLLRLVADGKIDGEESEIFEEILDMGSKTIKAYFEMRFAARKE